LGHRGTFAARFLTIALLALVVGSVSVVPRLRFTSVQPNEDMLQPGDIIFVDLYKGWCAATYWDHVAIYVGDQDVDGGQTSAGVVEATFNGGVARTPLWAFLERDTPTQMAVRRLRDDMPSCEEAIQNAIDYALAQVGKPFDYTATAGIPWKFNSANLHCAELVWRAYKAAGIDLDFDGGPLRLLPLLYPDNVYYSSKLGPVGER
jgi:uncharacterized protein YycO